MPNDKITVEVIAKESELFCWIVQRMEEIEPFTSVPVDFNSACDTILEDLQTYRLVSTPLVTKKGVRRAVGMPDDTLVDYVERSEAIVDFLGEIGDILQERDIRDCLLPYELITAAAENWSKSVEFFRLSKDKGMVRIIATSLAVQKYNVYFDIVLNDFGILVNQEKYNGI